MLASCHGFLHADGCAGFNGLYRPDPKPQQPPKLIEVACWAHAQRKIYDVALATDSAIAKGAVERIARLFALEAVLHGRNPQDRRAARQEQAVPLLAELHAFLVGALDRISGKSSLAQTIRYALSRWEVLLRYTTDGRLEMTNNAAERAIRPLARDHKNWLFAGADSGGERAALMYTILQTARLNGLNPEAYLRDVLGRIADHPINRIDELLPWKRAPSTSGIPQWSPPDQHRVAVTGRLREIALFVDSGRVELDIPVEGRVEHFLDRPGIAAAPRDHRAAARLSAA